MSLARLVCRVLILGVLCLATIGATLQILALLDPLGQDASSARAAPVANRPAPPPTVALAASARGAATGAAASAALAASLPPAPRRSPAALAAMEPPPENAPPRAALLRAASNARAKAATPPRLPRTDAGDGIGPDALLSGGLALLAAVILGGTALRLSGQATAFADTACAGLRAARLAAAARRERH
jgi:hypothetical protein